MKTVKKYQCKKCDASFTNGQALGQHCRWEHPKRKAGRPRKVKTHNGTHQHPFSNPRQTLAEVTADYRRAADIAAALAFLRQHGEVSWKENV